MILQLGHELPVPTGLVAKHVVGEDAAQAVAHDGHPSPPGVEVRVHGQEAAVLAVHLRREAAAAFSSSIAPGEEVHRPAACLVDDAGHDPLAVHRAKEVEDLQRGHGQRAQLATGAAGALNSSAHRWWCW